MNLSCLAECCGLECVMAHSALAVLKCNDVCVSPPISATECPRARAFTQHSAELGYKLHERFITDRIKNDLLFDSLFAAANKIYLNGSYEDAIQLFEIAATIKPADKVTQQVISNIEEIIQNRDRSKNAAKYLAIADSLYKMKEFEMALDNYEMVIAFDSENVYAKNQIYIIEHRKKKRFPHSSTTYIGVNYNFTEVKAAGIKSTRDLTALVLNDQSLHQFGLSVYKRFGFHISQIRYSNEPNPSNVYSVAEMDHAHDLLENNGYSDRRMEYLREGYNGYQFTFGFYLSFFRPIHFMVGFTTVNATTWDVNLGDYMPVLAPSKGSNTYYTNKVNWQSTELTAGISIVFPYIQTEIIYDNVFKTISLRGGLNIPIVKKK